METNDKTIKKILVVDDDTDLRNAISHTLSKAGYKTIQAENGKQALEMIQNTPDLNLVCSDIRMPIMTGIELFDNVKALKIPFIMMTGFSELIDAHKAHSMGVNEFISKPFTHEDLLSAVELSLHDSQSLDDKTKKNLDTDYCRIQIEDFIMGSKVSSDVFLRLSESKYLLIARSSNPLSRERLESFKNKGLQYLYISKNNFAAYVGFNLKLAKVAMGKRAPISADQKLHLFKHTTEILLKDSFVNGVDKDAYMTGKDIMESTVQLLSESDDIFTLFDMLKKHSDLIYAHSMAVGVYASLIARQLGWKSQSTLFKISMAGLFHDIGKKEIPLEILEKNRMNMTQEEIKIYESHTVRGKEILTQVPGIPEEVVFAAVQHHESIAGCGFPFQTQRSRIQPISRLICIANEFCNLVLKAPNKEDVSTAHEALLKIYTYKKDDVELSFLRVLMEIFNYPVPADLAKLQKFKDVS